MKAARKLLASFVTLLMAGMVLSAHAEPVADKTGILEAFKRCDAAALKGKSGRLSKNIAVKGVRLMPQKGGGMMVKLQFTKGFAHSLQALKAETGYDFTAIDAYELKNGDVVYQHEEADGVDNYAICEIVRK